MPGLLESNFVEQPSAGCGAALPGIEVPSHEGRVVLPDAPARFMDAGSAADGADLRADIGVKGGFEETLLGWSGVEGHSSLFVVIRHLGVEGSGGTADRVGMGPGSKRPRTATPSQDLQFHYIRGVKGMPSAPSIRRGGLRASGCRPVPTGSREVPSAGYRVQGVLRLTLRTVSESRTAGYRVQGVLRLTLRTSGLKTYILASTPTFMALRVN